jgi:hypothetical protein
MHPVKVKGTGVPAALYGGTNVQDGKREMRRK